MKIGGGDSETRRFFRGSLLSHASEAPRGGAKPIAEAVTVMLCFDVAAVCRVDSFIIALLFFLRLGCSLSPFSALLA